MTPAQIKKHDQWRKQRGAQKHEEAKRPAAKPFEAPAKDQPARDKP